MSVSSPSRLHEARSFLRRARSWIDEKVQRSALDPFPLRSHLIGYRKEWFRADLRGGMDGALLAIPQGMAFAALAGLPLGYGITCSAVACTVGALFMSSRHSIYGPTNATAFMIASYFATYPNLDQLRAMPNLIFMVGLVLILGAFFRIADLGQYVSRTVIIAYLTGAAVQMIAHQLPIVLGIMVTPVVSASGQLSAHTLVGDLWGVFSHLPEASLSNVVIAILTFVSYSWVRRKHSRWPAMALVICFMSGLSYLASQRGIEISTYGRIEWADLIPEFPDFTTRDATGQFSRLFGLAVALAFMAMLENSSMARTLASQQGHKVEPNQDLFSLGMANLACAYLSGMPASHSMTRSLANYNSGAITPVSAIISGFVCLIGAMTVGPVVTAMPKATLATLVMCVSASLINRKQIRIAIRATNSDAAVFFVTLGTSLLVPLHVAIFTGVGASLILYLRKASRPLLVEYEFNKEGNLAEATQPGVRQNPAVSIVHVEGELFFGAAEIFRNQIQATCTDDPALRIIILRLKNARHMDATSVFALEELVHVLRADGRDLIISGVTKDVYRVLKDSNLVDVIGKENIFPTSPSNPNLATRNALRRAQQILGTVEPEVRIYYDAAKKKDSAS